MLILRTIKTVVNLLIPLHACCDSANALVQGVIIYSHRSLELVMLILFDIV